MSKLRAIIAGVLGVAGIAISAGLLGLTAPVAAQSVHHGQCTSAWTHGPTTASHGTAWWTRNQPSEFGCLYSGREHIHCVHITGGTRYQNAYGGIVTGDNVKDTATCKDPSWPLLRKAGWQIYHPGVGWLTSWYYGS